MGLRRQCNGCAENEGDRLRKGSCCRPVNPFAPILQFALPRSSFKEPSPILALSRLKGHGKTINDLSLYVSVKCGVVGELEGELFDPSCVDVAMMKTTTKSFCSVASYSYHFQKFMKEPSRAAILAG